MTFKLRKFLPILMFFSLAALIGCGSGNQANTQSAEQSKIKAPPRVEIKPGDKVGVAECDQYLEKYEACLKTKVPEPGRSAMQASINDMRKTWITVAVNPETRANLAADCKQNQEATKQTLKDYACAW